MSDVMKLSCPTSVVDCLDPSLDGIPQMQDILKDIDKSDDRAKIHKLSALLTMLTTADVTKDFQTFDGLMKTLHLIDNKNKKIAKLTFLILGQYVSRIDKRYNSKLLNMDVFGTLSKTLEDIDSLSYNFAQSSLFLLSSLVSLDKMGQTLVRKSKCLHRLIVLFLRILPSLIRNENWEEDKTLRESKGHCETWKVLCLSIKKSIYNPQNKQNQQQVNTIIPKSINFLGDWIHYATENDALQEFVLSLISLLVQVLFHNPMNQTSFAAYSGISIIVRGLNKFRGLPKFNIEITNKMIRLLNAAISGHKDNCLLTISLGGMDILLHLLKTLPNSKKFPVIVTLTHLVQKGDETDEKFVKAEGLSILAVATVNVDSNPTEQHAVSKLLKSWAGKISSYNNRQNKPAENDQLFRDNSLLKLKTRLDFDHQPFHEKLPTETSQCKQKISSSVELGPVSEKTLDTQLPGKEDELDLKTPNCNEIQKQNCQMADNSNYQNVPNLDQKESCLITEKNKNEKFVPNALNFGNAMGNGETMAMGNKEMRNYNDNRAGSTLQHSLKPSSRWYLSKENHPGQNTAKCIYNKRNKHHKVSPVSIIEPTCLTDASMLCSTNSSDIQSKLLSDISFVISPARETQGHDPAKGPDSSLCQNEQESRKNLNESSESEYASALDTSFDLDPLPSSCKAECNASIVITRDVTIDTREDYIDSSSQSSMETQCMSQDISAQNKLDQSFNFSNASSGSNSSDDRSKSHKRSRESYRNFIGKIRRHSGSDYECQLIRHSTPKLKNTKLVKKHFVKNRGRQRILNYQNISLPPSTAGFSAVTFNSSIASSIKSSNLQLPRQEIDNLEEDDVKFENNFQSILESSFSTIQ